MSWTLLIGVVLALGIALFAAISRRAELARMHKRIQERTRAFRAGTAEAQLQHPVVDLSRCLGCGTCVAACPEEGVLQLVHGQAVVVNGARCVGHAACERECPVGAITVTVARLNERRDVPILTDGLEAVGSPNLFLAGEVTAHALIKTAIEHGTAVADEVARRIAATPKNGAEALDLCIVGAGPAGLACALEAKRRGLAFVLLDQESATGGTVAKYPRQKLVVTQPVDLPLHGRLARQEYTKEELVELWHRIASKHELPFRGGEIFEGLERTEGGDYSVRTSVGVYEARHVCLALGRRGTPNKLGVPGEELPKVAYSLLDARSYQGRRIVVVGGGDTAVETALGLAEQPGNDVTLSYRRESLVRIRERNQRSLDACVAEQRLRVVYRSRVTSIRAGEIDIEIEGGDTYTLANDEVFVMAGGVAPFQVLERSGVSFDPALRAPVAPLTEQGTGLTQALVAGFALALIALIWALWHADYYMLPTELRPADPSHAWLRPGHGAGLAFGISAAVLVVINLLYLVRRSAKSRFQIGSLQGWMTSHVATGILALLCATLHGAMAPRNYYGGRALAALALLLVTGAIGRYFYAWVPRAANGRELQIEEVRLRLAQMAEQWDRSQQRFVERVSAEITSLIHAQQWKNSFFGRVAALWRGQRDLRSTLSRLSIEGANERIPEAQIEETLHLARKAHRTSMAAAHFEELRALLNTWRYVHRWVAVLMVCLLVLHILYALAFSGLMLDGGPA